MGNVPVFGGLLGAFGDLLHWLGDRGTAFVNLKPETQLVMVQTLLLVVGGVWVFYRFRSQRSNEPTLQMLGMARLLKRGPNETLLFVRVHVTNISNVNLEEAEATVTLLSASDVLANGRVRLTGPPQVEDPFRPIFGWFSHTTEPPVLGWDPEPGQVEPKECVDSEVAFKLEELPNLIALRFQIHARRHWWLPWNKRPFRWLPWRKYPYKWGSYAFVDTQAPGAGYQSLAFESHPGG